MKNNLRNQNGSVMLMALISVSISMGLVFFAVQSSQNLNTEVHRMRVRSTMAILERNISDRAVQPFAYTACDSALGVSSCLVDWNYFKAIVTSVGGLAPSTLQSIVFRYPLPYAKCPLINPGCGILMKDAEYIVGASQPIFRALLIYEGVDIPVRPVKIEIKIWKELLQSKLSVCTSGFFQGFDANGNLKCYQPSICSNWSIATSIGSGLDATCVSLPTDIGDTPRLNDVALLVSGSTSYPITIGGPRLPMSWWSGQAIWRWNGVFP